MQCACDDFQSKFDESFAESRKKMEFPFWKIKWINKNEIINSLWAELDCKLKIEAFSESTHLTVLCRHVQSCAPNTHISSFSRIVHVFGTLIQSLRQTFLSHRIFELALRARDYSTVSKYMCDVVDLYYVVYLSIHVPCMRPIFSHWVVFKFSYRIIRHVDLSVVSRKAITLSFSCSAKISCVCAFSKWVDILAFLFILELKSLHARFD